MLKTLELTREALLKSTKIGEFEREIASKIGLLKRFKEYVEFFT